MPSNHDNPTAYARNQSAALEQSAALPIVSRPKALFLFAATASFLLSVGLFFSGDHERGIFVGIWVPSILSAGALLLGKEARHE